MSNQYFQNVWPDTEESIKHGMSLSGLDSSPLLAMALGKARGGLETQIGQYLSDQGNQRAQYSLSSRLGLDPMSMISPYVQTGMNQGNAQANLDYSYAQQQAAIAYQQAIDKYNQQNALYKTIGMISPVGGAIYGGASGGGSGLASSIGGSMQTAQMAMPFLMAGATGGIPGMFGNGATPVNPSSSVPTGMSVNPYNYSMATSQYNPNNYFSGFGGKGGAV